MALLRAIGGIILGTVIAVVAGAVIDYLRIYPADQAARIPFLYPWLAGLGGLLGALLAVLVLYPATLRREGSAPTRGRPGAVKTVAAKSAPTAVENMPSFDFDAAAAQAKQERKAIEGLPKEPPK